MKEILPGIYQITLTLSGFSPSSVNIYLIRDGDAFCLIDTGWDTPESQESMALQLEQSGIEYSSIRKVIVTHCHIDHMGLAGKFKRCNQARFFLHRKELDLIKIRFSDGDNFLPMTDKFLEAHGVPLSELAQPDYTLPRIDLAEPDILLDGGERIGVGTLTLQVINTPGHTPGHISLYEPDRKLLFCGDLLLPTIATNAAFHVQHMVNPLRQYLDSLKTIRELDIDLIIPGHEYPFARYRERIDELIAHHEQKKGEILKSFAQHSRLTAYDISRIISWSPRNRVSNWDQLSGWDKRFAMLQTVAHLEELAADGRITRFCADGKIYYS